MNGHGYGFTGGHKITQLAHVPLAHEATVIARVQSMRTRGGHVPEPLSFVESQAYLRRVDRVRKRDVTVPQPLNASLHRDSATTPPPEVAAVRAGSSLPSGFGCDREHEHTAGRQSIPCDPPPMPDDEAGIAEYYRRAMAGEFTPF